MHARVGDTIAIESQTVGRSRRHGQVLEIIGDDHEPHYRVRWDDGQESFYYPGSDGHVVEGEQAAPSVSVAPRRLQFATPVRSAMSAGALRIGGTDTLRQVASSLSRSDTGALMVFEGDKPVGIITEKDVVRSLAAGADPDEVWAGDVVPLETYWGSPDDTLVEAADVMIERGIGHLPLQEKGELVGIVSAKGIMANVLGSER